MKSPMSPKRCFFTGQLGGLVDRVPVGNVVSVITVDLMEAAGVQFPGAHLSPECAVPLTTRASNLRTSVVKNNPWQMEGRERQSRRVLGAQEGD